MDLNLLGTLFRPGYFTSYFIAPGLFPHQDLLHCYIYMYNSHSNPAHGEVYLIQHYVIKFVSDLQHVDGFIWYFRFPPSIKLTATRGWNQQIMMLENGRLYHSMYLGIL